MRKCSVNNCDVRVYAAGMCSKHYNRQLTTGSVEDGPRARADFKTRFWRKVEKRGPDECWPWTGKARTTGYGSIGTGGRNAPRMLSNRAAWTLSRGPIPDGIVVRHKCHNRLCCNPAHLELGTLSDNVADMWARPSEAPRGNARLTEEQVEAIRSDPRPSRKVAPEYGVSDAHIRSIRNRRAWPSLKGNPSK